MRIVVTNDDGVHAPGIALLARAAAAYGQVWVVAPDVERSAVAQAITLNGPLRLRSVRPGWIACDGTPTDCIHLAINQMKLAPDVILSGVNPGPNLANDVLYSGTVAAAMEGARWAIPSVAISHCASGEDLLEDLAPLLPGLLAALMPMVRSRPIAFNVNLPSVALGPWRGMQVTRLGRRYYSNEVHERTDPRGRPYYWIGGDHVTMPDIAGSDCNAVRDGLVSVTPLADDITRYDAMTDIHAALVGPATELSVVAAAPDHPHPALADHRARAADHASAAAGSPDGRSNGAIWPPQVTTKESS